MDTSVQIFDDWLRAANLKKRFHPIPIEIAMPFEGQRERFNRRKEELQNMFLDDRSIDVYFDYIDDGRCNAGAWIHKGLGLIGMNKGAMLLPIDMFYKMLSHPEIWNFAGDRGRERRNERHSEGMPTNYYDLVQMRGFAGYPTIPQPPVDPIRKFIAELCPKSSGIS